MGMIAPEKIKNLRGSKVAQIKVIANFYFIADFFLFYFQDSLNCY